MLYIWNGTTTMAQNSYEVNAAEIFDVCVWNSSVVLTTSGGELLQFNGGGFRQLAVFPIYNKDQVLASPGQYGGNPVMCKNTLQATDKVIYINFADSINYYKKLLNMPSGIWCYDPNVGLYHKYSNTISQINIEIVTAVNINTTTDIVTIVSAPITGTEVFFVAGTALTPLVSDQKYFVIKLSATTIKLATTKTNALSNIAIDLTLVTGNLNKFIFLPNVDYGATIDGGDSGFVLPMNNTGLKTIYGTDVIYGTDLLLRDGTSGINKGFLITTTPNAESRGYFTTPKIYSNNITDKFNKVTLKFAPFTSDLDKIIIKYRVVDDMREYINLVTPGYNWECMWTGINTFTSIQPDLVNAVIGDEIEILRGAAGGLLTHVTNISVNAGTYTITIDENFNNYLTGDKSTFVFRNWKKFTTISYGDNNALNSYFSEQLGMNGKFIQLKIELRGIGIRIEELLIDNIYHLKA